MFQVRGQFDVKMDAKGRVALPARLRERIVAASEGLVLTHYEGCIQGFTASRWRKMERRFLGVSPFDRASRAFLLAFVAGAAEVTLDASGRINIPPALRRQAGLDKQCVVLSYLGTLEIWNPDRLLVAQGAAASTLQETGGLDGFLAYDPDDDGADL
ncbi:MAG: division/cell wall cluster transcriptional repressor MraZ [Deltaproteobacteria bacterium]|nr:division/cell wall cluster transcriptional repressor MraZ [Deltaproteobacteria bacterium]